MDEAARIRALREQGRLDDEQAERLLAALGGSATEPPPGGVAEGSEFVGEGAVGTDAAATGAATRESGNSASAGAATTTGTSETTTATPSADAWAGTGRRWARIELFAGALDVQVEPGLDAPVAESDDGSLEVSADGDGWRIAQAAGGDRTWIDRIVNGMRRSRVRVRIPAATGVELDVKAGDVKLRGVPALRGRLMAGDLTADALRAVDVALNAGDLDLRLDPEPGEHRVQMTAGDAEIRLPRDAAVTVQGRVNVGDVSAPAPFETHRSGVSERVTGTLGDGRARLSMELVTGDLDLKVG